jgi:dihydrofolate reductase
MKAIVCLDKNFGIGRENKLPWPKNKEDLKFFREITWGKNILMGRKTFEGLGVMFLPNRSIFVLTKGKNHSCWGSEIDTWPCSGKYTDGENLPKDIIICGGREIYDQFLPKCEELFVTHLTESYECDTFFPYSQHGINSIFPNSEKIKEISGGVIKRYYK